MNPMFEFNRLYPYILPPAVTFLVSFFLASLIIQTGDRNKENRLFVFFCLLQALINLATALNTIIISKDTALSISRLADMFYVFIIPVSVHFIFEVIDLSHRKKLIRGLYIFSFAMSPFTQTEWYFPGMQKFYFGYFPQGGPAFQVFGLVGLLCMFYFIPILYNQANRAPSHEKRVKARFILYGIVASAALTAGNILPILGARIYPPGNFGFIPLGFIAYGLLQHPLLQATKSGVIKDYTSKMLTILLWAPLAAAFIFWMTARPGLFYPDIAQRIFPWALPPILSFISCFILATFCFMQKTFRATTFLFGLIATIWGFLNLDIGFNMLHTDPDLAVKVSRFCHLFLVYQIGLSVHFIYSVIGRKERWAFVYLCYALGFLLMLFTPTQYYFQGTYQYFWGFFAKKNILFDLFGATSFAVIIWGIVVLSRAIRTESDIDLKKKYFYVLIGVLVTGIFNLFNIPALNGIELYPLGNFTFIPVLIMGYGIFRHNILKINIYTRRRILEKTVRIILMVGYAFLILLFYWAVTHDKGALAPDIGFGRGLWRAIDPGLILSKIFPYGIPPLIAFFCAAYFSMVAVRLGQNQPEALIFSLLCFLMAFVSFDILMNGIVADPSVGIRISRLTHLFLVFGPALLLHLIYIVIRRRNTWWLIFSAYIFALVMMPLTQTDLYIIGMSHYFWGFFAKGNLLFNVFALSFLSAMGYGTALLIRTYKKTDQELLRHRLLYLALGFTVSGALYLGNIFVLEGFEIYPPGNFVFIPLVLWSYALFRQNLNDLLQITRQMMFYLGLVIVAVIIAVVFKKIFPSDWHTEIYFIGIIASILILTAVTAIWKNILALFFGEQKAKLDHVLETVHNNLSASRTLKVIFQILKKTIFNELLCSRYAMFISSVSDEATGRPFFSGWEAWNPKQNLMMAAGAGFRQDAPVSLNADHPLLGMFSETFDLAAREQIEEWLMQHDRVLNSADPLFKAEYILPILFEDNLSCLILFGDKVDGSLYSSDEKDFIHRFGLSLGPYIENAKLLQGFEKKVEERTFALKKALNETKAKEEEITHINEMIQTINSTLNLNVILSSFEHALHTIFDFNQIGIFLISDSDNRLYMNNYAGSGITEDKFQALKELVLTIHPGISMNCETVLRNIPALFSDITPALIKAATPIDRKAFEINPTRAILFCPLEFQKKVIGTVVFAHTEKPFHLTKTDIDKIQRYVSQIATAVNNAKLTEETRKALQEARAKEQEISRMNQIVQIVNSTLNLDKVAVAVSAALKRIFDFDQMSIQLLNETKDHLVFIKTYGGGSSNWRIEKVADLIVPMTETESVFVQPILKRKPIYIRQIKPDVLPLMSPSDREIYHFSQAKAYLFLPIQVHNEIIGTIGFGNTQSFFDLEKKDIERIEHFVSQIATAIHNARLYNDLNKARQEAESATKYKSEFLANMSHEIRTPLNAILGLTGLTLNTALTPKQKDYLKKIKDSSDALFRIVNDILDFSKIEAGKLDLEIVEFKIDDIMTNLANMFSGQVMEKGIEMIFTRSPEIPEILAGDPLRLGQILTNLVSNAFKFTDQGEILIRAELLEKEKTHAMLKFTVKDTGIGIDSERLQVLFDPFTQADGSTTRKYGGTGLGLAICRKLVTMMEGDISADSVPGAGSAFFFTARFRCPSEKTKKIPTPHPDLRGLKVLLVDDNKTVQMILMDVLASFQFEPTAVSSAEAALAALFESRKHDPFDLILLDWKLPGMDGIECAKQIRKHPDFGNIPIVMMTAFGREDVKDLADQAGINAYLTKPMTSSMMIDTFMEVFGRVSKRKVMAESIREKELETFVKLKGARLLLVEDNPINQQVAVELLKSAELNIDIANNGKEAWEAVSKSRYDAVLMDVQMPVMDGYEATRRIRENPEHKGLPIIAMTAHAMMSEKQKCLDAGMNDHIPKPIDPKFVFDTLSKWIQTKPRALSPVPAESAREPFAAVDLPDQLSGIDVAAGVHRVAGNKALYRDLLIQFRGKYLHIFEDIRQAFMDSRLDHAGHLAHTVKGIAGNIGANSLHRVAGALEKALNEGGSNKVNQMMASFKEALDQALDSIGLLEADTAKKPAQTAVHKIAPADIVKAESALSECARLLKSDFAEAMNRMEFLKTMLKETPEVGLISELEKHMNAFNIEGAQAAIAAIDKKLRMQTE